MKRPLRFLLVGVVLSAFLVTLGGVPARADGPGQNVGAPALDWLPKEVKEKLTTRPDVKQCSGVINSLVAQPPYLVIGVINQANNSITGFVVTDTTDTKQAYLLKSILLAFEQKRYLTVYYTDPGSVIYAVVVQ